MKKYDGKEKSGHNRHRGTYAFCAFWARVGRRPLPELHTAAGSETTVAAVRWPSVGPPTHASDRARRLAHYKYPPGRPRARAEGTRWEMMDGQFAQSHGSTSQTTQTVDARCCVTLSKYCLTLAHIRWTRPRLSSAGHGASSSDVAAERTAHVQLRMRPHYTADCAALSVTRHSYTKSCWTPVIQV